MGSNARKCLLLHNELWRDTAGLLRGPPTWPCGMSLDRLYREIIPWNSPSEKGKETGLFYPAASCLLSPIDYFALWVVKPPVLLGCFIGPFSGSLRKPELMLCEEVCHQGLEVSGALESTFSISWPQAELPGLTWVGHPCLWVRWTK